MVKTLAKLVVAFSAKGVREVVMAHGEMAEAQERLAVADEKMEVAKVASLGNQQRAITNFQHAQEASFRSEEALMTRRVVMWGAVSAAILEATHANDEFAKAVRDIRDLSGSSTQDATRAALLARITGMGDTGMLRDIMRSSRAAFTPEGLGALGQIGVQTNIEEGGLQLFNNIADALERIPDGARKASLEMQIFGARNVAALLPLLELTKAQREQVMGLADDYNSGLLASSQQLSFQFAFLGQQIMVGLVYPLAQALSPAVMGIIVIFRGLVWVLSEVNSIGGTLKIGWIGIIAGFVMTVKVVRTVWGAISDLVKIMRLLNWEMIIQKALSGPAGWATLAAAGVITGVGLYWLNNQQEATPDADKHLSALNKNTDAINRLGDNFDAIKGKGGIGSMMQSTDPLMLKRIGLSAVG